MVAISRPLSSVQSGVRPFDVQRDLDAVANLVEQCFADTLDAEGRRYIQFMHDAARNPSYLRWAVSYPDQVSMPMAGFVWEEDGQLVGNLSLIPFSHQGQRFYLIANVAVNAHYRRKGIARSLTLAALEHLQRQGIPTVWLHVWEGNQAALNLYQSVGFAERARRTAWECTETGWGTTPLKESHGGISITSRRASHWLQQDKWLREVYPAEIAWQLPFNFAMLRPGAYGLIHRFLKGSPVKHWAALRGDCLLGVLTWLPLSSSTENLWLATDQENEDETISILLPYVRTQFKKGRRLLLDYPAGRAAQALHQSGFYPRQTLIWMEMRLR